MIKTLVALSAFFSIASSIAQTVDIGRATISLPNDGEWVEVTRSAAGLNYSGEVAGSISSETKTFALLNGSKEWLALVTISASKSTVGSAIMSWTGECKTNAAQVAFDLTNGSFSKRDCLTVRRNLASDAFMAHPSRKGLKESLDTKSIAVSGPAYFVAHMVGTESGTFIATNALISHKALKKVAGANTGEAFEGKHGVAWGHLLAQEAKGSAYSIRGRMAIPSLE